MENKISGFPFGKCKKCSNPLSPFDTHCLVCEYELKNKLNNSKGIQTSIDLRIESAKFQKEMFYGKSQELIFKLLISGTIFSILGIVVAFSKDGIVWVNFLVYPLVMAICGIFIALGYLLFVQLFSNLTQSKVSYRGNILSAPNSLRETTLQCKYAIAYFKYSIILIFLKLKK